MIPVWMHQSLISILRLYYTHNLVKGRGVLRKDNGVPVYVGHNTMAAAVQFVDRVNTVSTYAQQIQTPCLR